MAEQITEVLGIVGIKNCGVYDAQTSYERLNVVTYRGSTYCALQNCTGISPTNDNYWQLYAEKGDTGPEGPQGEKPVKGVDYYTAEDKEEISQEIATDVAAEVSSELGSLVSATPEAASSMSDMTDTTKIYVLTTNGHWYWYNGTDWVDGGVYQSTVTDDYIKTAAHLIGGTYKIQNKSQHPIFYSGGFNISTGAQTSVARWCRTGRVIAERKGIVYRVKANGWKLRIGYYSAPDGDWANSYIKGIDFTKEYVNALEEKGSYICLCLSKDDETAITTEELASVNKGDILEITYLTDKELQTLEAPADARVVGNAYKNLIRNDDNSIRSKTIYNNSGINQYYGNYQGGTSNRHRTGRLSHTVVGTFIKLDSPNYLMRVFYYNHATADWEDSYVKVNSDWGNEVIINTEYPYFALEFKNLTDTALDSTDAENIRNSLFSYTFTDKTLSKENVPADAKAVGDAIATGLKKTIKILGVGNSYTMGCIRWIVKILNECNYNAIVGHGMIGGTTLQQQYESLDEEGQYHSSYAYYKYNNNGGNYTITQNKTLDEIFVDEDWDVVVLQQQSDEAGQYNSFVNSGFDINDFVNYIKTQINNPNLKVGLNCTWSHNAEYTGSKFIEYYNGDPTVQYNTIQSNFPAVANHMDQCDFVINTGLAVEIARGHDYIKDIGSHLLRDNNHLSYGIPEFMASYMYCKAIVGIKKCDFNWYPTSTDSGAITQTGSYLALLAKEIGDLADSFTQTYNDIK